MYAVIYGVHGQNGAILAVGTTYQKAVRAALLDYNDQLRIDCAKIGEEWVDATFAQMRSIYAAEDKFCAVVQVAGDLR